MRYGRPDYEQRGQRGFDPTASTLPDEPVFLLVAHDRAAPHAVRAWANEAERLGAASNIVALARRQAELMEDWQAANGSKVPDLADAEG